MRGKFVFLIGVVIIMAVSSGCIEISVPETSVPVTDTQQVEMIMVNGVDKTTEIHNNNPIELMISGVENTVTVSQSTVVVEIMMSGVDNTLYIPASTSAKIMDSGVDNQIIRY